MQVSRRSLIQLPAALALAGFVPLRALADDSEGSGLTPAQALAELQRGNELFGKAVFPSYPIDDKTRRELARGQAPFAAIVSCSDSRVGPEQIFGQGLGKLFVVRNAGNTTATPQSLGSVEYAVVDLKVSLILVLGHTKCGAVKEATYLDRDNKPFPPTLEAMLLPIVPAVVTVRGEPGDPVDNAVYANVTRVVAQLRSPDQPLLYPPQKEGKLRVVGGVYNLETGLVDFFDPA